jgi:hypothetical protein
MNAFASHIPMLRLFVVLTSAVVSAAALAQGTVIFSGGDVSISASDGSRRMARQGDVVREGERITTGPNAMAQVRFADGSFAGIRQDSNVELRQYRTTGSDQGVTLVLAAGGVRVVNVETADRPPPLPMRVQSPEGSSVMLRGGDLETGRARGQPPESSFVARLNAGNAIARTSAGDLPLPLNNVSGIGRAGITTMPPNALPPPSPLAAQDRGGAPGKPPAGGPGSPPQPGGPVSPLQAGGPGQPLAPGGAGLLPPPGGAGFAPFAGGSGIHSGPGPQPGVPFGAPPPQIPVAPTAASSMIGSISKPPANPQPPIPGAPQQNSTQFVAPHPGGNPTILGGGGPGGSPFQGTTIKPPPR